MDKRRQLRKRIIRIMVFERDEFTCQLCGWKPYVPDDWDGTEPLTNGKKTLTIDHIIERALGGPSTQDNFRAACNVCNVRRSVHVGKLVREGQRLGLDLEESRLRAAASLGLDTA